MLGKHPTQIKVAGGGGAVRWGTVKPRISIFQNFTPHDSNVQLLFGDTACMHA